MDKFAEFGGNFIDTADIYGPFNSEQIGTFAIFVLHKVLLLYLRNYS